MVTKDPIGAQTDDEGEEINFEDWLPANDLTPEASLELAEVEHAIQHCLQSLFADFRAVVTLVEKVTRKFRKIGFRVD